MSDYENKLVADFSQQTDQVEVAAPGVGVLSTVPTGMGSNDSCTVDGTSYSVQAMALDEE